MNLDKAKTLRAAEKFLESGKIAAAIKEYCQIVAVDASDFTTLNMLGDLYTRVGNTAEAVSCFRRIAEHYHEQGFGLKAIAMYKKIDRLQPNDIEIATNLADLYAQQDLIVEARAHYLAVVEAYDRAGAAQSALEILRKVADLDPQNTQIRTKLAEGYLNQGSKHQAAECFAEAGHALVARGAFDDGLEVFSRALAIQPEDSATLKGMVAAHSARGTADEAAELIEAVLQKKPEDSELLALLATAYLEAEEPDNAERATTSLVAKEPAAYMRLMDVARLYIRHGEIDKAVNVVAKISEQLLAEREHSQLFDLVNELLAGDADNVQALRVLVRAHWWLRDMGSLKDALERLAEAAQAQDLNEDERYALTQLTSLDPAHEEYLARLTELGGPIEEATLEAPPEFEAAQPEAHADSQESFVLNSQEFTAVSDEATFDWNPVAEVSEEGSNGAVTETGFSFESIVAQELPNTSFDTPADQAGEAERVAAMLRQELESVDFYIAQGYVDIAVDTLNLLEQQCGEHPDIASRREKIKQLQTGAVSEPVSTPEIEHGQIVISNDFEIAAAPQESELQPEPAISLIVPVAPSPDNNQSQTSPGIDAGLAEIFEEYRASSESDADSASNGDFETHYNLGLAYKDMDLFEDALEEFQFAVNLTSPADATSSRYLQCCNLLGHCFVQTGAPEVAVKWFAKGLNAANISEEERMALTYEAGAAYEQAGDLHRALESFTEVYGNNVSYRNVNERVKTLKARLGEKSTLSRPVAGHSEQLVN